MIAAADVFAAKVGAGWGCGLTLVMMRSTSVVLALALFSSIAVAQESKDKLGSSSDKAQEVFDRSMKVGRNDTTLIGERPSMPEFLGRYEAMVKYIDANFHRPSDSCPQGKIYVSLTVDVDGSISDVRIKRGMEASLDAEAIRVVRSMPHWAPAIWNGVPIRQEVVIPINVQGK